MRQRSKRAKSYRWSPRTIVQNSHSREPCVTDRTMKSDSSSRLGVAKTHPGWRREFGNSTSPRSRSDTSEQLAYRVRQQQLTADFGLFAFKTHDIPTLLHEATRACGEGLLAKLSKVLEYLHAEGTFVVAAGIGWDSGLVGHARVSADIDSPTGYEFQNGELMGSTALFKRHIERRFFCQHCVN